MEVAMSFSDRHNIQCVISYISQYTYIIIHMQSRNKAASVTFSKRYTLHREMCYVTAVTIQ